MKTLHLCVLFIILSLAPQVAIMDMTQSPNSSPDTTMARPSSSVDTSRRRARWFSTLLRR